jgi:ABC-type branched-subunit amino acid transport system substrate-binding protein
VDKPLRSRWTVRAFSAFTASAILVTGCSSSHKTAGTTGGNSGGTSPTSSQSFPAIPAGPIKFGAIFELSGPLAAFGASTKSSITAFVDSLNQAGGIAGRQIDLVSLNDQGDPTTAVNDAQQLISDNVAAVLYAGSTEENAQSIPVFMKAKVPVVTFDPSDYFNDGAKYPYLFDPYNSLDEKVTALVNYAKTKGWTNVAVLTDNTTYGQELGADFKTASSTAGLTAAASQQMSATAVTVTTELQQLRSSGAQALFLLTEGENQVVYNNLNSMGWKPPILTSDASYYSGISALGPLAATTYANCSIGLPPGGALDPQLTQLVAIGEKTTGGPQPYEAPGLLTIADMLQMLKYSIEKANSISSAAITQEMLTISNKSFSDPNYAYSFTQQSRIGWPSNQEHTCLVTPLGSHDTPTLAS